MITVPEVVLSNIRSLLEFAHRAVTEAERNRYGRVIDRDAITSVSMALRIALVDITIGVAPPKFAALSLKSFDLALDVLNTVSHSSLPALLQKAKRSLSEASGQMRPYLFQSARNSCVHQPPPRKPRRHAVAPK